jgi:hypothetical protein
MWNKGNEKGNLNSTKLYLNALEKLFRAKIFRRKFFRIKPYITNIFEKTC